MRHALVPLLTLALAGCGRQLPSFSAPAPAGALSCAVRQAEEIGYRRLEGRAETGTVRLGKRIPPADEDRSREVETDLGRAALTDFSDIPIESQIRASYAAGRLTLQPLGRREPDVETRRTGDAAEDAQRILALCSSGAQAPSDEQRLRP